MGKFDFSDIYSSFPEAIAAMPSKFNSHELILEIARKNQKEYIDALFAYKDNPNPFMHVHRQLSSHIKKIANDNKLKNCGDDTNSKDIFGKKNVCRAWKKIHHSVV